MVFYPGVGLISLWRVIDTDLNHPYYVTAADEALAISCGEHNALPTLHFYRRTPPGISVGYFRSVAEDVNLEACEKLGITIVRRSSGGGTIFTDQNQLILGIITRQSLGVDMENSFQRVCNCLIEALKQCGVIATFKPPNDLVINGKKVSGSAQVKKKNAYIIHSTIILRLDMETINSVLKNPKPGYTSSIEHECGQVPRIGALKTAIKIALEKQFGIEFQKGEFSKLERELIRKLIENKYSTHDWNFKR